MTSISQNQRSMQSSPQPRAIATSRCYHAPPGFIVWNSIARHAVQAKALDLVNSARAMALVNFGISDAVSAIFESALLWGVEPARELLLQFDSRSVSLLGWTDMRRRLYRRRRRVVHLRR